jgi:hypothetical protein
MGDTTPSAPSYGDPSAATPVASSPISASGAAAGGLGLLGAGFKAYTDIIGAEATKAGDEFKAAELQRQADYGRLKATQTNAQMTRNLAITLGHMDAVRAAAHTDPTSPTGAAVRGTVEDIGTEQKGIKVENILQQARQNEADAQYLRYAGNQAMLAGEIGAGADIAGGLAGALKSGLPV